jgi:hypothetical protein
MIIKAKKESNGWKLIDASTGEYVQEGYAYPTKQEAMDGAKQIWPSYSVWHGRKSGDGWKIDTD